jgi:dihydrofolate reductase
VLPERKCFVVSSTLKQEDITNATVIREIFDIERHLLIADDDKTAFIIGGSQIYAEGIAMADTAYITAINQEYGCDKFFPTQYIDKHFTMSQMFKADEAPDLRFLVFKRK